MWVITFVFVSWVLDGDWHLGQVPSLHLHRQGTVQIEVHLSAHLWPLSFLFLLIFLLLLSIVWFLLMLVLSPLNFVKLVVLRFGHRLVRMLLLEAMRLLASSVFMVLSFLFLPFSIPPLRSSFALVVL